MGYRTKEKQREMRDQSNQINTQNLGLSNKRKNTIWAYRTKEKQMRPIEPNKYRSGLIEQKKKTANLGLSNKTNSESGLIEQNKIQCLGLSNNRKNTIWAYRTTEKT